MTKMLTFVLRFINSCDNSEVIDEKSYVCRQIDDLEWFHRNVY